MAPNEFQNGDAFTIEPRIYVQEGVFNGLPGKQRNPAFCAYAQGAA